MLLLLVISHETVEWRKTEIIYISGPKRFMPRCARMERDLDAFLFGNTVQDKVERCLDDDHDVCQS